MQRQRQCLEFAHQLHYLMRQPLLVKYARVKPAEPHTHTVAAHHIASARPPPSPSPHALHCTALLAQLPLQEPVVLIEGTDCRIWLGTAAAAATLLADEGSVYALGRSVLTCMGRAARRFRPTHTSHASGGTHPGRCQMQAPASMARLQPASYSYPYGRCSCALLCTLAYDGTTHTAGAAVMAVPAHPPWGPHPHPPPTPAPPTHPHMRCSQSEESLKEVARCREQPGVGTSSPPNICARHRGEGDMTLMQF